MRLPRIDAARALDGTPAWAVFLLGMLLSAGLAWLALQLVRHLARARRVRRAARASRAERAAAGVLRAHGYDIVGSQVRRRWSLWADGRELGFDLVADYLVEGGGVRWIAEVKTGERALDLRYGPTRRQLLEYRHAFGVDGVLLVDAEAGSVCSVRFREPQALAGAAWWRSALQHLLWLGVGLILGVLLTRALPGASARAARALEPEQAPEVAPPRERAAPAARRAASSSAASSPAAAPRAARRESASVGTR